MQEKQITTFRNGFKIVHSMPILSQEEAEERKKKILLKLYNLFCTEKKIE